MVFKSTAIGNTDCRGRRPRLANVPETDQTRGFPGAKAPDRTGSIDSSGLRLTLNEWGDPDAPAIAMVHGGFDFSRTFDVFAPMIYHITLRQIVI